MKMAPSKILIYGFKPYGKHKTNITAGVINALPRHALHRTIIFPVRFDERMFIKAFDQHKPDLIIGLGQHPRAKKIRIERRAVNRMALNRKSKGSRIDRTNKDVKFATITLPEWKGSVVTYDAGTYVCNYSMWQSAKWCEKNGSSWTFLHVPLTAKIPQLVRYLLRIQKSKSCNPYLRDICG